MRAIKSPPGISPPDPSASFSGERQLSEVPRVQCGTCRRFLMHGRFSNRQLDRYRGQYRQNRGNAANITLPDCMNCTGRPATELKCTQCDITKGLDAFTKVQRKNPDNAKCKDCVQEIVDWEPEIEVQLEEMKIREDTERGSTTRGSGFSTTASLAGYDNSGSATGTSLNGSSSQVEDESDGVWIPRDHGSSINYSDMQNPANRAHKHRSASISSASTNISETTTSSRASSTWAEIYQQPRPSRRNPSTHAGSVNGSTTRGTNPGFANVRGDWRQPTPRQRAEIAAQREERRQLEAQQNLRDDEDSDDEPFEGEL